MRKRLKVTSYFPEIEGALFWGAAQSEWTKTETGDEYKYYTYLVNDAKRALEILYEYDSYVFDIDRVGYVLAIKIWYN